MNFRYLIKQEINSSFIFKSSLQNIPQEMNVQVKLLESTPIKGLESNKLFRQSFTIAVSTDSCNLKSLSVVYFIVPIPILVTSLPVEIFKPVYVQLS